MIEANHFRDCDWADIYVVKDVRSTLLCATLCRQTDWLCHPVQSDGRMQYCTLVTWWRFDVVEFQAFFVLFLFHHVVCGGHCLWPCRRHFVRGWGTEPPCRFSGARQPYISRFWKLKSWLPLGLGRAEWRSHPHPQLLLNCPPLFPNYFALF